MSSSSAPSLIGLARAAPFGIHATAGIIDVQEEETCAKMSQHRCADTKRMLCVQCCKGRERRWGGAKLRSSEESDAMARRGAAESAPALGAGAVDEGGGRRRTCVA